VASYSSSATACACVRVSEYKIFGRELKRRGEILARRFWELGRGVGGGKGGREFGGLCEVV
jgi:hypothetical protein